MKIVIARPSYDEITEIMNAWAQKAMPQCTVAMDLNGPSVTEENLRACLKNFPDTKLVAFYGHGTQESLVNQGEDSGEVPVIHTQRPGVTATELKGRSVYAVACNAGAKLGPALAAAGADFVGYKRKFYVIGRFEEEYGRVVNGGLVSWATSGKARGEIRKQLRSEWLELSDSLESKEISDPAKQRFRYIAVAFATLNGSRVCAYGGPRTAS